MGKEGVSLVLSSKSMKTCSGRMLRDFSGAFWSEFKDIIHPCFDQAQTGGPCNNLGRLLTIFTHFLTGIFVLLDLEIGI